MLTGIHVLDSTDAYSRVMYGILTGIGFIGGGAILKDRGTVAGTATAASIWNTGAIGVAVAWGTFEIAMVLTLLNFLTLRFMPKLKKHLDASDSEEER
jgi:putative Mg2+ transporter-C (MgtC) family protein